MLLVRLHPEPSVYMLEQSFNSILLAVISHLGPQSWGRQFIFGVFEQNVHNNEGCETIIILKIPDQSQNINS